MSVCYVEISNNGSLPRLRPVPFFGKPFRFALTDTPRKQRIFVPFVGEGLFRPFRRLRGRATAAPRFCQARSTARRLLLAAVGVPRFDPRPEGKGAGVQNAGMRAPVGRRLRAGGVVFRVVSAFPLSVPSQHPRG